jgi:2-(1,2-epoxy-1,2-dihydrophenyl)acetyl-CoA isomerase
MTAKNMNVCNDTDAVVIKYHADVALIRLNRPRARNALVADIKCHLETAIPSLMMDNSVRCLVITGSGEAFCAGGDINSFDERRAPLVRARMQRSHDWAKCILTGEKPVVAAVNGAAVGAGFALALLCDIIVVADDAYFRAGFAGLGAAPDLGAALTLTRSIGVARAKDILLTNRRIEAAEAVAIGIAKRMAPAASLVEEAMQLATDLAAGPTAAFGLTKLLLNNAYGPINDFFATEAAAQAVAFGSGEFDEGVSAFFGKRKPDFKTNR